MTIDIDKLRNDMRDDCIAAYFGGGFGAAIIESCDNCLLYTSPSPRDS